MPNPNYRPGAGSTGAKTNPTQRQAMLTATARLDRRGYSTIQIAQAIGVTETQVSKYLLEIQREYAEARIAERAAHVAEKILQLKEVRAEAWEAFEKSKLDKHKVVVEKQEDDGGVTGSRSRKKTIRTREGRLPAAEYLELILRCFAAERELLGLDAPKKLDARILTADWSEILLELESPQADRLTVEGKIEQMLLEGSDDSTTDAPGEVAGMFLPEDSGSGGENDSDGEEVEIIIED